MPRSETYVTTNQERQLLGCRKLMEAPSYRDVRTDRTITAMELRNPDREDFSDVILSAGELAHAKHCLNAIGAAFCAVPIGTTGRFVVSYSV